MGINQNAAQNSMEKLSSGLRINRAGDDAAGLAISEKMRGQIRGLDQANRNAQDGISLIQTAEGALNETHSILQRMRELAVQSSNDTNNDKDREELQKEVNELSQEITRIADNTEFNTKNLMGPEGFEGKFHIGANAGQDITLSIADMSAKALQVEGEVYEAQDVTDVTGVEVQSLTGEDIDIKFAAAQTFASGAAISSTTAAISAGGSVVVTLSQAAFGGTATSPTGGTITATNEDIKAALESVAGEAGLNVVTTDAYTTTAAGTTTTLSGGETVNLTGWTLDEDASRDMGINISSQEAASAAITTINDAIERVSAERSMLGAVQNRLEHTISNLNNSSENLQAAESRVRDVDMAREVMEMTKSNILSQASQAMLAQANQAPQAVLQLLG